MTHTDNRPLTTKEIDDGWHLDEAPLDISVEPYAEFAIERRKPDNGFEEAYWEQVENRILTRRIGDDVSLFGAKRPN